MPVTGTTGGRRFIFLYTVLLSRLQHRLLCDDYPAGPALFFRAARTRTTRRLSNRPFAVNVFSVDEPGRGPVLVMHNTGEICRPRCRSRHLHTTKQHFPVVHTSEIVNNTLFVRTAGAGNAYGPRVLGAATAGVVLCTILRMCRAYARLLGITRGDCCSSAPRA